MFQLIHFPAEALPDVRALIQLTNDQLSGLTRLLNTKDAAPPIEQSFEDEVRKALNVTPAIAESIIRVSAILQGMDLSEDNAAKVISDFEQLVESAATSEKQELLDSINSKRSLLQAIAKRTPAVTRELNVRRIGAGTQPGIHSIRTIVQLRPLFERDEDNTPIEIECLIPAMTLELKFSKDDREHSATFSLSESKLDELIESLEDARNKWQLLHQKYSDKICR